MKKILYFLMIFLMIVPSCMAEDVFSIRNGITFGMTREQVIAQEALNGRSMSKYSQNTVKPSIEGEKRDVTFYFDENGLLDEVCYHWYDLSAKAKDYIRSDEWAIQEWDLEQLSKTSLNDSKQRAEETFETIEAVLNEKYPEITPLSVKWPVTYSADASLKEGYSLIATYVKCVQRLIPYREGYIVIENFLEGHPFTYNSFYHYVSESYDNVVSYEYVTAAEYQYRITQPYITEYLNDIL